MSVIDPNVGDTHTITVDDPRFEIVNGQLKLLDAVSLDREIEPTVIVDITAVDQDGLSYTEQFVIGVTNLIDEQPTMNDASFSIEENSVNGSLIGFVVAVDPDAPDDSITYSIESGNESGAFAIDSNTGEITVADSSLINFEVNPSFDLIVKATDLAGLSDNASVTVNLIDVNDAPVGLPVVTGTATEDQTLTADVSGILDADGLGTFSYQRFPR